MTAKFAKAALAAGTALAALGLAPGPAAAQDGYTIEPERIYLAPSYTQREGFDRFVPRDATRNAKLDYSAWNEALDWFVLDLGPSLREGLPRPQPSIGSRVQYGHTSRYRMEGSRVTFSLLTDDIKMSLKEYRADLERIGTEIDIATLPRNEQLSFWLNLHNVAIIEMIADRWPVKQPHRITVDGAPMDESPFINVGGVAMSPKDIRTKIVYPNWSDSKVIYGFFRGVIGGPAIDDEAFTGENVAPQLAYLAGEFVNSLRGVERSGDALQVSKLYEEARPFYFQDWPTDMRTHIERFARDDVRTELEGATRIEASVWEADIADLVNGERETPLNNAESCYRDGINEYCPVQDPRIPPNMSRALIERQMKVEKLIRTDRIGKIIIIPESELGEDGEVD